MPVKAPQQLRSVVTRERLLEATAATLVERGLAGTSTQVIATRAGVSQGAVFKHFPAKPDLLAAAIERVLANFVAEFRADVAARLAARNRDTIEVACAALWSIFRQPAMRAVFEVYIAARTDDALAARLGPILDRHRAAILAEARRLFPTAAGDDADLAGVVDAVVFAMQGAALGLFSPDPDTECHHLEFLERLARRELARLSGGA